MGLCALVMKLGLEPSEERNIIKRHFDEYIRRGVDQAFTLGTVVSIRTKVHEDDSDATNCPRCWSQVELEPNDVQCPACHGSGWISTNSQTGYRLRIFSRAHIPEFSDERRREALGEQREINTSWWVNFTERELRDGDIIAKVEPDDIDHPKYIKNTLEYFEVIGAEQPALHPGYHPVSGHLIVAQQVNVMLLDYQRPERTLDMGGNLKI